MSAKKIVLKVCILCRRCRRCIMSTVAKMDGIKSLALDVEKSTLTVVGEVDVVCIVNQLRKVKKMVAVESVGPPDKKEEEKKKDDKLPECCSGCRSATTITILDEPYNPCSIL